MARVLLLVLDSLGVGALPDAANYGDEGSNTLGNIARAIGGISLPNLEKMGLGKIIPVLGISEKVIADANYGKMAEKSAGKDTTTGHWELAGLIINQPFPTYPNGFPKDVIEKFEGAIGRKTLGNVVASGTAIIEELGEEHVTTGYPIIYTSADSVFQIAAHEEIIPLEQLYQMCHIAREQLTGEHAVGRVIARPFIGQPGRFTRTENRRDYSLLPIGKTALDRVVESGLQVIAVGKVDDIFAGQGITRTVKAKNNEENIQQIISLLQEDTKGLIFTNLVDFDMLFGHRNDPQGYANALKEFDGRLPEILQQLKDDDLLIITADHGTDPTTPSTDHSREYVPVLVYGNSIEGNQNLGTRETFADVAQTISDYLRLPAMENGTSLLKGGY